MRSLFTTLLLVSSSLAALVHPGGLHTDADFERVKAHVDAGDEPWTTGWNLLTANSHAQATYTMRGPVTTIIRGSSPLGSENYVLLYNDIHAAYQLALRWRISGNTSFADTAVSILDAWASTATSIEGDSNRFLASGIYGYEMANAGELMRNYTGWTGLAQFQTWMSTVFYPLNENFLVNHNDAQWYHYRANWDLCNMASALAIGILTDNQTMFDWAISRFTETEGTGQITHFLWQGYEEDGSGKLLEQGEEAGRDQGHATLDFSLIGAYAQMAYNQGQDLFAYNSSQILGGSEYVAKYNLGFDVPYTPHIVPDYDETVISNASRGDIRPAWELLYAHYGVLKGLNASWTEQMRDLVNEQSGGAEGGGGNYGSTSGGFDQLGFGTLMYRLE